MLANALNLLPYHSAWNGGGETTEKADQGPVCFSYGSVPLFDARQQPSQHLCDFDSLDDIAERQYCVRKEDIRAQ